MGCPPFTAICPSPPAHLHVFSTVYFANCPLPSAHRPLPRSRFLRCTLFADCPPPTAHAHWPPSHLTAYSPPAPTSPPTYCARVSVCFCRLSDTCSSLLWSYVTAVSSFCFLSRLQTDGGEWTCFILSLFRSLLSSFFSLSVLFHFWVSLLLVFLR